jgi:hypothetical protein
MTIATHCERDGWTWYTDPAGRIVACGTNPAAVRGAVRGSGYQIEGETVQDGRHCDTCVFGLVAGGSARCIDCLPPDWTNWRTRK